MSFSNEKHTFRALDGIRGILAMAVVYMHSPLVLDFPGTPKINGGLCVDFFFILSGFVIAHTTYNGLHHKADMLRFMARRIGRLWPLHASVLAVMILAKLESTLVILLSGQDKTIPFAEASYLPYKIFTNLFMVQTFDPNGSSWNFPSWSVSVEFWTYILFGLLLWKGKKWLRPNALLLVTASILAQFFIAHSGADFLTGFLRGVAGFFAGYLVYVFYKKHEQGQWLERIGNKTEILAALVIGAAMAWVKSPAVAIVTPLAFTFPLFVFALQQGVISRLLQLTPIQNIGKWSYGIYLIHMPINEILNHWLSTGQKELMKAYGTQCQVGHATRKTASLADCSMLDVSVLIIFLAIYLSIVLLCARWVYNRIEVPARKKVNAWADERWLKKA